MSYRKTAILLLTLLLPACAAVQVAPLQKVRQVQADGSLSAPLADKELSPFQVYLRNHLNPAPQALLALEMDVPEGTGDEGGYLALVRQSSGEELQYIEQNDHQPRTDRFFHRMLTTEETSELDGFMAAHPLGTLQVFSPVPLDSAVAATEPGDTTRGAETSVEPAAQPAVATAPDMPLIAGAEAGDVAAQFRFTQVQQSEARTVMVQSPGRNDHPVIDLLEMLARFRSAAPFACTYLRPMPLTAKSMYADPNRKVLWVWTGDGNDLRIAVSGPAMRTGEENGPEEWLAYRDGQWTPSAEPGADPRTAPTTEPARSAAESAAPATEPAPASQRATRPAPTLADLFPARQTPATLPSAAAIVREWRLSHSDMLPRDETWWTAASTHATTVFHYVPLSPTHGVTHGFVVPGLEFDDAHFAVDESRGMLYLIDDGQLFSLVIPEGAK